MTKPSKTVTTRAELSPRLLQSAGTENNRFTLTGVGLARLDPTTAVAAATNGRVLCLTLVPAELPAAKKDRVTIVPQEVIQGAKRGDAVVAFDGEWRREATPGTKEKTVVAPALEGDFPTFLDILPTLDDSYKAIGVNAGLLARLATSLSPEQVVTIFVGQAHRAIVVVGEDRSAGLCMPCNTDPAIARSVYERVIAAATAAWKDRRDVAEGDLPKIAGTPAPAQKPARHVPPAPTADAAPAPPALTTDEPTPEEIDAELWEAAQAPKGAWHLDRWRERMVSGYSAGGKNKYAPEYRKRQTAMLDRWDQRKAVGFVPSDLEWDELCEFQERLPDGTPFIAVLNPQDVVDTPHLELRGAISESGYASLFYDDTWPQGKSVAQTAIELAWRLRQEFTAKRAKPAKKSRGRKAVPAPATPQDEAPSTSAHGLAAMRELSAALAAA